MELKDINTLIFIALEEVYGEIETGKASMFSTNDLYAHPPFLRFRFKELAKDDPIYLDVEKAISRFRGNLKWSLITNNEFINYIIIPEIFINKTHEGSFYKKEFYVNKFTESIYRKYVDLAIIDIPNLATHITRFGPARARL